MAVQPAIDIRGLTKDFGTLRAVDGIDISVEKGEIFGLLGPDGAGKTTTMRMLVGITDPTSGDGTVLGRDFITEREEIKKEIGYVSQRFSLYGDLTVAENLDFFAEIYEVPLSERAERNRRMLEFSRLEPFQKRLAQNLSGGMKQKLALACTLMHTPSLLFLDEPTTGVDPVSRRDFWKILYQLVAEGMTLVISTPYMDEAERCSRLALMDRGRILRIDTPSGIKDSMTGAVLEITVEPQRTARDVITHLQTVKDVQVFGDRLHVMTDDPETTSTEITRALQNEAVSPVSIREISPGLEDVFVSIVEESRRSESGDANG